MNNKKEVINACKKITNNNNIFNDYNKNIEKVIKKTVDFIFINKINNPEVEIVRNAYIEIKKNNKKQHDYIKKDFEGIETKAALATLSIEQDQLLEIYKKYL